MQRLAVLLACVCCFGCRARDERALAIVVSGDTAGWIVPCGCASNQYGGLPRRGTYVEQLRSEMEVIVADAGGAAAGTSPYDRLKLEAILRGEMAMGIAAHNVGAAEAALGPDALSDLSTRLGVPVVSANVRRPDGELVAEPVRLVQAAGRRVALVGVLDPQYAKSPLAADPPREAVLWALHGVAGRYDAAVVLAYLPEDRLRALAASLPEVDVVAGGPTGQPIPPESIGPTLLASATHQGKFLARFDAPLRGSARWEGSIVPMDEQLADDPGQLANLQRYYDELAARDFTAWESGLAGLLVGWDKRSAVPPTIIGSGSGGTALRLFHPTIHVPRGDLPPDYRVAGNAKCRECHEEDGKLWAASKHAHAWEPLVGKGTQVDPFCQRCHAMGYGLPGGFVSAGRSLKLVHVGCESCHGPSQAHARNEKVRTAYYARAEETCAGCHDRENSPKFAYDDYWGRIKHGEDAAATPAQAAAKSGTTEDP